MELANGAEDLKEEKDRSDDVIRAIGLNFFLVLPLPPSLAIFPLHVVLGSLCGYQDSENPLGTSLLSSLHCHFLATPKLVHSTSISDSKICVQLQLSRLTVKLVSISLTNAPRVAMG
jgi:hypothetical protein